MDLLCPNFETCGGELAFRIYQDGDGDPNVPNGTRSWTEAECVGQSCACDFDDEGWKRLEQDAIEAGENQEPWGVD